MSAASRHEIDGNHDPSGHGAERDRQRESDAEQSQREPDVALGLAQLNGRRVGEQDQREGQVGDEPDRLGARVGRQHIEKPDTEHRAGDDQDDRRGDRQPIESAGSDRVHDEHRGHQRPSPHVVDPRCMSAVSFEATTTVRCPLQGSRRGFRVAV